MRVPLKRMRQQKEQGWKPGRGKQERARRRRQIDGGQLRPENGLARLTRDRWGAVVVVPMTEEEYRELRR